MYFFFNVYIRNVAPILGIWAINNYYLKHILQIEINLPFVGLR